MQVCVCPVIVTISNWMTDTSICKLTKPASSLSSAPMRERERERKQKVAELSQHRNDSECAIWRYPVKQHIPCTSIHNGNVHCTHTLQGITVNFWVCHVIKKSKKRMFRMSFHLSGEKQFLCINKTQENGNGNCHKIPIKVNRCCTMHNIFK